LFDPPIKWIRTIRRIDDESLLDPIEIRPSNTVSPRSRFRAGFASANLRAPKRIKLAACVVGSCGGAGIGKTGGFGSLLALARNAVQFYCYPFSSSSAPPFHPKYASPSASCQILLRRMRAKSSMKWRRKSRNGMRAPFLPKNENCF